MALRCFADTLERGVIALPDREARHARLSRRLSAGDEVMLFDGRGREARGVLADTTGGRVEVRVGEIVQRPRPSPALTLAVALPKGPRQDTLIEKCTELGVARIQPLLTQRSVASASDNKLDKWRRTTIEAAKQSGQCWLPELCPPRGLTEVLAEPAAAEVLLAATQSGPTVVPILDVLEHIRAAEAVRAFIGPEGGWTDDEVAALTTAGAKCVSLGPHVLRIETAAIAVGAICHAITGTAADSPDIGPPPASARRIPDEEGQE